MGDDRLKHWSKLTTLQLGQYAEYMAKMRMVQAGWEVYTSEIDDRGIDFLVRTGPGRCLEVQVKSVRLNPGASTYVYFRKEPLGCSPGEIADRMRRGFTLLLAIFEDGSDPDLYVIPGSVWLDVQPPFTSYDYYEGKKSAPEFGLNVSQRTRELLLPFAFTADTMYKIARVRDDPRF